MKLENFLIILILCFFSLAVLIVFFDNPQVIYLEAYARGIRDGKSQCYPYSVPHVEAIEQGGKQ